MEQLLCLQMTGVLCQAQLFSQLWAIVSIVYASSLLSLSLSLSADPSSCLNTQLSNKCLQDALECAADVQVFHVFAYKVSICVQC